MASEVCVFCGQKPGRFRSASIQCGATWQTACKSCEKELQDLDELELCRRALVRGLAEDPDRIRDRIAFLSEAEQHRLSCSICGGKLRFEEKKTLDCTPYRDGILTETFDVIPAYCPDCGKYEFFHPAILRKNRYLNYLAYIDTNRQETL